VSFVGSLLLAPPEKRKVVRVLAIVFGIASIMAVGAEWFAAPLEQLVTRPPESNQSGNVVAGLINFLLAVPFPVTFASLTFAYVGLFCVAYWLFTQIQANSLSLRQAAVSVWGSHVARLRSLLLAGIICFVLTIIYPGPPLLLSHDSVEWFRKVWYEFLYGNHAAQHYSPLPADTSTWFWGQATLSYFGCFAIYLLFAFPHEIAVAWQAGRTAQKEVKGTSSPAEDDGSMEALSAFVSSLVRQLRAINRGPGNKD